MLFSLLGTNSILLDTTKWQITLKEIMRRVFIEIGLNGNYYLRIKLNCIQSGSLVITPTRD